MAVARSHLVDVSVTPWYHVISGTVRGALLLGEGGGDRKQWIEDRLEELTAIFAMDVAGFAVLDSHLHVLVRLSPERVAQWSDEEVVRRWGRLVPPRGKGRRPLPVSDAWVKQQLADANFLKQTRERLADLGWFMKFAQRAAGTAGKSRRRLPRSLLAKPLQVHRRTGYRGPAGYLCLHRPEPGGGGRGGAARGFALYFRASAGGALPAEGAFGRLAGGSAG
ncbi:MAG: hypothetical protein U1E05_09725 [Patescibacteria group bacterium]|nr:hypothetical protein [Patescibacteria group bacterium]